MSKRGPRKNAKAQAAGSVAMHLEPKTASIKSPLLDDDTTKIISRRLAIYSKNFEAERSRFKVLSDDASERNRIEDAIQSAIKKLGLEEELAEILAVEAARRQRMEKLREKTEGDLDDTSRGTSQ